MVFKNNNTHTPPTEMDHLKENLANAEREIQQKIAQLGQLFYQDHKDDPSVEPAYLALIDQIKKTEENKKNFYQNMLRLEGKMMCLDCGAIIPYGSIYCNFCGKRLSAPVEAPKMPVAEAGVKICSNCGQTLENGESFCTNCGQKVL